MLRLRFFNVGDGDCILIEEPSENGAFRMLVDTGRAEVPEPAPAAACAEHLSRAGVRRIPAVSEYPPRGKMLHEKGCRTGSSLPRNR